MDIDASPFVVLDVETTGLSPDKGHRVCEFGAIRIVGGREKDRYSTLINPERDVDPKARQQHGIRDEELQKAPVFSRVSADLRRFLAGAVLVGQNIEFDLNFLNSEFARCGMSKIAAPAVDTIALARRVKPGLPTYNLDTLAQEFRIKVTDRHRSIGDCEITVAVFLECVAALRRRGEVRSLKDLVMKGAPR